MRYTTTWRNKWLTADAKSIPEMADMLESASKLLREMHDAGIKLENDDIQDDYAYLVTEDPDVAEKFDLHLDEYEEDEEEEDENSKDDEEE